MERGRPRQGRSGDVTQRGSGVTAALISPDPDRRPDYPPCYGKDGVVGISGPCRDISRVSIFARLGEERQFLLEPVLFTERTLDVSRFVSYRSSNF